MLLTYLGGWGGGEEAKKPALTRAGPDEPSKSYLSIIPVSIVVRLLFPSRPRLDVQNTVLTTKGG